MGQFSPTKLMQIFRLVSLFGNSCPDATPHWRIKAELCLLLIISHLHIHTEPLKTSPGAKHDNPENLHGDIVS